MVGVGIAQPSHPQSGSQAINRLYAARGQPNITRTGRTKVRMVLYLLGDVSLVTRLRMIETNRTAASSELAASVDISTHPEWHRKTGAASAAAR